MTNHEALMRRAMHMAETARIHARPNPWVGAVVVCVDGTVYEGATQPQGGPHAEIVALNSASEAGADVRGATLYSTLEPCSHTGRTGPCTEAIISAGITRVISAISDPDDHVAGSGFDALRAAGIEVITDVLTDDVSEQLAPYLHHRRTGRPFVMLKMATTLDARTSIPNGPRWITGEEARVRVHQLRAESDAIVVGSGTIAGTILNSPFAMLTESPLVALSCRAVAQYPQQQKCSHAKCGTVRSTTFLIRLAAKV